MDTPPAPGSPSEAKPPGSPGTPAMPDAAFSAAALTALGDGRLPGLVGFEVVSVGERSLHSRLSVRPDLLAPNGYLHAATVVALADTSCGYGCRLTLPAGGTGFTTIELKANFLGTAVSGGIECRANLVHGGRTTQVWDATVTDEANRRTIALFRCTQLVLYPPGAPRSA